jgi:NTE family protein
MPTLSQEDLLARQLRTHLGGLDADGLAQLQRRFEWVELPAGQTLMTQGEPGDAMYMALGGRLRAYIRDADGVERMVREMARGQIIGEMSLYTDAPRSATVVAIRDSVLVRLDKAGFEALLASSAKASVALTRQLIGRLQSAQSRSDLARPVAMTLMPISAGVDTPAIARGLARHLATIGSTCVVDADVLDAALGTPGLARSASDDETEVNRRIALYLDALESRHEFVVLVADDTPTAWTARCSRRCDELLLVADADAPPELHESERRFLMGRTGRSEAAEILLLLHPAERPCPKGTEAWLSRRPVTDHVHLRPALDRDMARLARLQSRTAVGLVLAGGGARGCAHLGVYRALREHGIEVDCVGGTSIGSVMALLVASDREPETITTIARRAFAVNPTGDFNAIPLLSLIKGRRLHAVVEGATRELLGGRHRIEDLWKNYYCVASNYSQASELVLRRGPLTPAIMASVAIPGALPPVLLDGDLLCDGGTFNNFPVDVMRTQRGIGQVIGVDLSFRKPRKIALESVPGAGALLLDRLRPRARRRYRLPSLMAYLMNVTILYSSSRQRAAKALTDVYFNPPLDRVGMLQWKKFDQIVQQGYEHGCEGLAALPADTMARLRPQPPVA